MTLQQALPLRQVICGDCLEVVESLPFNSIDCVMTDTPYGVNYVSGWREKQFDAIQNDDSNYSALLLSLMKLLKTRVKRNAHLYFFTRYDVYPTFYQIISHYFEIKNLLVWEKNNTGAGDLEGQYAPKHELIIFANGGGALKHRYPDVLHFDKVNGCDMVHPTQKPVDLIEMMIANSTNEGDVVLDPFLGSGTTAVACEKLRRKWIGIEINKDYCEIARKRLEPWMNQTRLDTISGGLQQ